jgi:hypothetical protein
MARASLEFLQNLMEGRGRIGDISPARKPASGSAPILPMGDGWTQVLGVELSEFDFTDVSNVFGHSVGPDL